MIHLNISSRDRGLLGLGACMIGSLISVSRGVPALREWDRRERATAAAVAGELVAGRSARILLRRHRDSLAERSRRLGVVDSVLVSGSSSAAAAAELTARLERVAASAGIKISSIQIQADSVAVASLARVRVRIAGVGDVTALATVMHAVESGETPFVIRELVVSQSEPAAPDDRAEALHIELLVEGMALIRKEPRT